MTESPELSALLDEMGLVCDCARYNKTKSLHWDECPARLRAQAGEVMQRVMVTPQQKYVIAELIESGKALLTYLDDHAWGHVPEGMTSERFRHAIDQASRQPDAQTFAGPMPTIIATTGAPAGVAPPSWSDSKPVEWTYDPTQPGGKEDGIKGS